MWVLLGQLAYRRRTIFGWYVFMYGQIVYKNLTETLLFVLYK